MVTTGNEMGDEKVSKKQKKATVAEMFLDDDIKEGLTGKKFTQITDKRRRMGIKRRYLKDMMKNKKKTHR